MTYFSNFGIRNISGTAEDTCLRFSTRIQDTKQKCKTGLNGAWHRSHVTPPSRDLLVNKEATKAFRNGKIRESTAFDFQYSHRKGT